MNILALTDDTDFKTREVAVSALSPGLDLQFNFIATSGAYTSTQVSASNGGSYDWGNNGDGMYAIEIPATGGASINNDIEGVGWFTGFATGVLPWRGPMIGFRAAGLNNALIDSAYSATRGLAGTALPDAAADAGGGLPISDTGGLDLDAKLAATNEVTAARMSELDEGTVGKMANQVDEIRTDTGEIGTAGAGLSNINLPNQTMDITGSLSGSVGSVAGNVGGNVNGGVGGNVVGTVGSVLGGIDTTSGTIKTLDALDTAQDSQHSTTQGRLPASLVGGRIDATVDATGMESGAVDAIWAKAMSELSAVPGVTGTVLQALEWVFLLARNLGKQTSSKKTLFLDDGSTELAHSDITDDNTTFTRGEWADGA